MSSPQDLWISGVFYLMTGLNRALAWLDYIYTTITLKRSEPHKIKHLSHMITPRWYSKAIEYPFCSLGWYKCNFDHGNGRYHLKKMLGKIGRSQSYSLAQCFVYKSSFSLSIPQKFCFSNQEINYLNKYVYNYWNI